MLSHYSTPPRVVLRYLVRIEEGTVMQSPSGQVSKDRAPVSISNPVPAPSQWSRPTLLHASTSKITGWEGSGVVQVLHYAYRNERIRLAWWIGRSFCILFSLLSARFLCFFNQKCTTRVLVRVFYKTILTMEKHQYCYASFWWIDKKSKY